MYIKTRNNGIKNQLLLNEVSLSKEVVEIILRRLDQTESMNIDLITKRN